MRSKIIAFMTVAAVVAVPVASFAATYDYVDTSGYVTPVSADNAADALTVANIDPTSGVILDNGTVNLAAFVPVEGGVASPSIISIIGTNTSTSTLTSTGTSTLNTYQYVDVNGNIATVQASSADQAAAIAGSNMSSTSGVVLVQ